MIRTLGRAAIALLALACVGATGSIASASVPAKSSKACKLLTTDEVSTAIQRPVGKGVPQKPSTPVPEKGIECQWKATETQGEIAPRTVNVSVFDFRKQSSQWKSSFGTKAKKYVVTTCDTSMADFEMLQGIGDAACRYGFLVNIAKGPLLAIVSVPNLSNDPAAAQAAKDLAALVAKRI